jgi:hypothetical protein
MFEQFHAWPAIYRDLSIIGAELLVIVFAFVLLRLLLGCSSGSWRPLARNKAARACSRSFGTSPRYSS